MSHVYDHLRAIRNFGELIQYHEDKSSPAHFPTNNVIV